MERSGAALVAARAFGRIGRPKGLSAESERKMKAVKKLYVPQVSISEIRKTLDIVLSALSYPYAYFNHLQIICILHVFKFPLLLIKIHGKYGFTKSNY